MSRVCVVMLVSVVVGHAALALLYCVLCGSGSGSGCSLLAHDHDRLLSAFLSHSHIRHVNIWVV